MTSVNNLALMLSETLSQMQQQQAQKNQVVVKNPGSCSKPGSEKAIHEVFEKNCKNS